MTQHKIVPISECKPYQSKGESVRISFTANDYLHIAILKEKAAAAFGTYAQHFNYDAAATAAFFADRVHFQLGKVNKLRVHGITAFDSALDYVIAKIQGGTPLGIVVPHDGEFTLRIDVQAISRHLDQLTARNHTDNGYSEATVEDKIDNLKRAINSVTEHEFYHLIQYMASMRKPKSVPSYSVSQSMRLLFAYAATTLTAAAFFPRQSELPIILTAPLMLGATMYLHKGRAQVEHDEYEAQKKALGLNLSSPYKYLYEKGN